MPVAEEGAREEELLLLLSHNREPERELIRWRTKPTVRPIHIGSKLVQTI